MFAGEGEVCYFDMLFGFEPPALAVHSHVARSPPFKGLVHNGPVRVGIGLCNVDTNYSATDADLIQASDQTAINWRN